MQAEQAPTPGVSSRRSACDRCRGQKLGCLRENADPEGRCDRCSKADVAQCITSPVYHMRNYSVASDYPELPSPSHKRRRPADRPGDAQDTGRPTPQQQNQGQSPTPPSAAPEATSTPFEWPSIDTFVPMSASDASSSNFGSINWNTLIDPLPPQPSGSAAGSQTQGVLWPTYNEDTIRPPSLGNIGNIDLEIPNGSGAVSNVPPNDTTQGQIEEISRINLDLAAQLSRMVKGPPHVNLKTIIAPDCGKPNPSGMLTTPLEDLLATTRQYLDVLGVIVDTSRPRLPTNVSNPSQPSGSGWLYGDVGPSNTSSAASTSPSSTDSHDDGRYSWTDEPPSITTTTQSSSASGPHAPVDTSTFLVILACYIHILRLNVALFAHIREYFQMVSESDNRTINPLPGLCGFDNFPLQSGNLQSTMIIHLVTNMFERIENLLGLPRELRLGSRKVGNDGLLGREGLLELSQLLIHTEDRGRPEEGKGGVKSLRSNIKKEKRLLRDHIAP
ncbi:hypothetical protein V8F06_010472 [Rhypophila decipiens]